MRPNGDPVAGFSKVVNNLSKPKVISVAIITFAAAFMVWSTWLTWPDPIYDFGTHLYCPWQLGSGKHLYTDVAYFNGPLSEYFNAAMFKLFGASVHTLMWVNAVIALGVIAVLFRLVNLLSDKLTATSACLVFVIVFAFSRYQGIGIGNYNWICPYTHEITHGVALSLAMVLAISVFLRTNRVRWLLLGSTLMGMVFLTKAEIFVPTLGSCVIGLMRRFRSAGFRRGLADLFLASLPFATVLLMAFVTIALQTSSSTAVQALRGSWPWVFDRRIGQLQFYQQGLGTDHLRLNLWRMLLVGLASTALFGTMLATGIAPKRWRAFAILLFIAELVTVCFQWQMCMQIARPWPVFLAIITGIAIVQSWRADHPARTNSAIRAMFAMLALGLLGKMFFNARPWQYGFALAMPAAMVLVEALLGWVPTLTSSLGYDGVRVRWAGLALVAVAAICLYANQTPAITLNIKVASGSDEFFADHRGDEVNRACRNINALIPPKGTLAVMPQGLMLNFLTRRADSISIVNIMPPEVISSGENFIVEQLTAHPPDLIVLSEKDIADGAFILTEGNLHYGQKIYAWVMQHYQCRVPADEGTELRLSIWVRK